MRHRRPTGPRRRPWLAALAVAVAAVAVPAVGPAPAGAIPAPLVTPDGVGIRVDEKAITGAVLAALETALQPLIDDHLRNGAIAHTSLVGYSGPIVTSDLDLAVDFLTPAGGHPDGAVALAANIAAVEFTYYVTPSWPWSPCTVTVRPDDATATATADVDPSHLPATPATLDPSTSTWGSASETSTGICWLFITAPFDWPAFSDLTNPASPVSLIEDEVEQVLTGLLDELWNGNVRPVLDSLASFGTSISSVSADDHGLVTTADVHATGGITLPGPGGPYDVSAAEDAGVTTNVHALLANTTTTTGEDSDIIVSIHPNVTNQHLHALTASQAGNYGTSAVGVAIESVLVPNHHASYADGGWTVRLTVPSPPPTTYPPGVPYALPTGAAGWPQVTVPALTLTFRNSSYGFGVSPVAVFSGTMDDIDLLTVPSGPGWAASYDASNADLWVTRTFANPHAATVPAQAPVAIRPYARDAFTAFVAWYPSYVDLSPQGFFGIGPSLCACSPYSGDQRYTETFQVP